MGSGESTMCVQMLKHGIHLGQKRNRYQEKTVGFEENGEHDGIKAEGQDTGRSR